MDNNNDDLIVGGYKFATIADAETARMEEKKVENLEQHLDYRKPQNVLLVYNKAIENTIETNTTIKPLQSIDTPLKNCKKINRDTFATTSYDGTIKIWKYNNKKKLVKSKKSCIIF